MVHGMFLHLKYKNYIGKLKPFNTKNDAYRYGNWGVCFTYGTWFAMGGLTAAGKTYNNCQAIRNAVDFLLKSQRSDGGWGESYLSCPNKVMLVLKIKDEYYPGCVKSYPIGPRLEGLTHWIFPDTPPKLINNCSTGIYAFRRKSIKFSTYFMGYDGSDSFRAGQFVVLVFIKLDDAIGSLILAKDYQRPTFHEFRVIVAI